MDELISNKTCPSIILGRFAYSRLITGYVKSLGAALWTSPPQQRESRVPDVLGA